MMTVRELIVILQLMPPTALVVKWCPDEKESFALDIGKVLSPQNSLERGSVVLK